MPSLEELKINYMNTVLKDHEQIDLLLGGINLVTEGGVDGIREAVQAQPDLLVDAIVGLGRLVNKLESEKLQLIEDWFITLDRLHSLGGEVPPL